MADDKLKRGAQDCSSVSAEELHEARYLAEKYGINGARAREIIDMAGHSREKADAAVERARK